mgnify:CR=1 FL=1
MTNLYFIRGAQSKIVEVDTKLEADKVIKTIGEMVKEHWILVKIL